ncbi:hypothetical protein P9112_001021 [Eukaryota sp. TZLM1-RC]
MSLDDVKKQALLVLDTLADEKHSVEAISTAQSYLETLHPNIAPIILPHLIRSLSSFNPSARCSRARLFASLCTTYNTSLSRFLPQFMSLLLRNFADSDNTVKQALADCVAALAKHCRSDQCPNQLDAVFIEPLLSSAFTKSECASTCFLTVSRVLSVVPRDQYPQEKVADLLRRLIVMLDNDQNEAILAQKSKSFLTFTDVFIPIQKCIEILGNSFSNLNESDILALIDVLLCSLSVEFIPFVLMAVETLHLLLSLFSSSSRVDLISNQIDSLEKSFNEVKNRAEGVKKSKESRDLILLITNCLKLVSKIKYPTVNSTPNQTPQSKRQSRISKNETTKRPATAPRSRPPPSQTPQSKPQSINKSLACKAGKPRSVTPKTRFTSKPEHRSKSTPRGSVKPWQKGQKQDQKPKESLGKSAVVEVYVKGSQSPVTFSKKETEAAINDLEKEMEEDSDKVIIEDQNSVESSQCITPFETPKVTNSRRSSVANQSNSNQTNQQSNSITIEEVNPSPIVKNSISSALSNVFEKDMNFLEKTTNSHTLPPENVKIHSEQRLALESLLRIEREHLKDKYKAIQRQEASKIITKYKQTVANLQQELVNNLAVLEDQIKAQLSHEIEIFENDRRRQLESILLNSPLNND